MDTKRCWTCKLDRAREDFASNCSRRCASCHAERLRAARCACCGQFSGLRLDGEPRRFCDAQACQREQRSRAVGKAIKARKAKAGRRSTRQCAVCQRRKPLDESNFYVTRRDERGAATHFEYYCRPCKTADQQARYHGDERRRASSLQRAKRQRERVNARRASDPAYDRAYRERQREYERARRARRGREPVPVAAALVDGERGGSLPAAPLARAIERWIGGIIDGTREAAAEVCGVDVRTVRGWLDGEYATVRLDAADRALIGLDLLWFDVWDPAECPRAVELFEGKALAVA